MSPVRIALALACAALAFCAVFFGGPWFLALGGLTWPAIVIFLLACVAALLVLSYFFGWWTRRVGPVA